MRVAEVLANARARGVDRLDAHLLLAHRMQCTRAWLIAHDDAPVASDPLARFSDDVNRRLGGEPIAYIIGRREFHGLMLRVSPAVLVPRPETELLVDWALEVLAQEHGRGAAPSVLDLGTGSGAIALAVKAARPATRVTASDASPAALRVARHNADELALSVEWLQGSWWEPLAGCAFDLALSNPPYIAADDPHLEALAHEPPAALQSGADGLADLRTIIAGASAHLRPGGRLIVEHGFDQGRTVRELLRLAGFSDVSTRSDLAGHERCSSGRRADSVE